MSMFVAKNLYRVETIKFDMKQDIADIYTGKKSSEI